MKRALWRQVKVGSWVIFADPDEGPYRAKVIETDIKIYTPGEPSVWGYPYGLTRETGTVRILYNSTEAVNNLAELLKYNPSRLGRLRREYNTWQSHKATADAKKETYLSRIQEYKAL